MQRGIFVAAALALLVLLSGCSTKLSHEERMLCIELSSQAKAAVPECDTEQECYVELESSLFNFSPAGFTPDGEKLFYNFKNDVALSWLYFNRARDNAGEINSICSADKGYASLPRNVNEFNSNLLKAFEYSDLAHSKAFAIIAIDYFFLDSEEIHLIREEPLYDSFLVFGKNLSDFQLKKSGSTSFSSIYFSRFSDFQKNSSYSLLPVFVKESSVLGLLGKFDSHLVKEADLGKFWMPIFSSLFSDSVNFFISIENTGNAVSALRQFPSNSLMQAYSGFVGTKDSSLEEFSALMSNRSSSFEEIEKRNMVLKESISETFSKTSSKIDSVSAGFSFEKGFIKELYSDLNSGFEISSKQYSISDLEEFSSDAESTFFDLERELAEINSLENLSEISLGSKTSRLKNLNADSIELLESINYLEEEVLQGLLLLCENRVSSISNFLNNNSDSLSEMQNLSDTKSLLSYSVSKFESAESQQIKLVECSKSIASLNLLKQALADYEIYKLSFSESVEKCFSRIELILSNPVFSELELLEFKQQFLALKQISETAEFESISRQCLSLKKRISVFIHSAKEIHAIENDFKELELLYSEFSELQDKLSIFSKTSFANAETAFKKLKYSFSEQGLNLTESESIESLNSQISELKSFIDLEIYDQVLESIRSRAYWTGDENNKTLVLENLVYPLKTQAIIELQSQSNLVPSAFSSNISKVRLLDNSLLIDLNYIPLGSTVIKFDNFDNNSSLQDSNTLLEPKILDFGQNSEKILAARLVSDKFSKNLDSLYLLRDVLIPEKVSFFRKIFAGTSPEEMVEAKYIPPISSLRLEKIEQESIESVPITLARDFADFEKAVLEENWLEAAKIAEKRMPDLESKLSLLSSREKELSIASDSVKEEAIASYNNAVAKFNVSPPNQDAEKAIQEAEEAIKENSLMQSILLSRNATALLSVPEPGNLVVPSAIIILVISALLLFFVKYKRKKDSQTRKGFVKKILKNW